MRWRAFSSISAAAHPITPATAGTTPRASSCSWLLSGEVHSSQNSGGGGSAKNRERRGTVGFKKVREEEDRIIYNGSERPLGSFRGQKGNESFDA